MQSKCQSIINSESLAQARRRGEQFFLQCSGRALTILWDAVQLIPQPLILRPLAKAEYFEVWHDPPSPNHCAKLLLVQLKDCMT